MKARWALALALVLVLAGCSGLSAEDGTPDRTPYGVEDELEPGLGDPENESQEPDSERLAPGLTTAGVDNASVLVDAHYETLEAAAGNRTYVVRMRESRRAENGSEVQEIEAMMVVDASNGEFRRTTSTRPRNGDPRVSEAWAENGLQLLRYERPNGTAEYHAVSSPSWYPPLERSLRSILSGASDASVEADSEGDTTWYRVTANVSDVDGVRNLAFVVRDDGHLQHVSYARTVEHYPNVSVAEMKYQFDAPGPESIERPDWFEEALEETDRELPSNETDDEGGSGGGPDNGSDDEPPEEDPDDESTDEETDDEASSDEAQAVEAVGRSLE